MRVDPRRLLEIRKRKDLSQTFMAQELGLSGQSAFSRKERTGDFTEDEIKKMSILLGTDIEDLVERGIPVDVGIDTLLADSIRHEAYLNVILRVVGELLADKKGIMVDTFLDRLTAEVNDQSLRRLDKS